MPRAPLVVFSHLRWDFGFGRPQQLMTRMGQRREVLFVEEPLQRDEEPWLEIVAVAPGLRVCRPVLPAPGPGFGSPQQPALELLLRDLLERERIREFVAWLETPMATPLARSLRPRGIVYDCMDELAAAPGAPPGLAERERELLAVADVVFTGGAGLYRSRSRLHPFVRCFPDSVDVAHFSRAASLADPPDQAGLPRPRLGFHGVIDERLDLDLLAAVARSRPDWSIVLLGPVARDPGTLPRLANLHLLGPRPYEELPAYLGHWDVAVMPFAAGPATRFLSPVQVLESMAAGRPVVSTPLPDVTEPHGGIVHLAEGPERFAGACEQALAEPAAARELRAQRARSVLQRTSWNETVRRMDEIVHFLADFGTWRDAPHARPASGARTGARA